MRNKESRKDKSPSPAVHTHLARPQSKVNTPVHSSVDLTPQAILTRAAYANLAVQLARWLRRHWHLLPPLQRSALAYALDFGGHIGDGQVSFIVQLSSLLEALDVLRRQPEQEEEE